VNCPKKSRIPGEENDNRRSKYLRLNVGKKDPRTGGGGGVA